MRFERDDARVGLLVLLAILLFFSLVFYRSIRAIVHRDHHYKVRIENAADLATGTEVQLQGFRIGQVESIELERDGAGYRFIVTIGTRPDVVLWRGVQAIVSSRILGNAFVDLRLPPVGERISILEPGQTMEGGGSSPFGTLVAELTALSKNLNQATSEVRQELETHGLSSVFEHPQVRKSLEDFRAALSAFRAASAASAAAMEHADSSFGALDRNLESLQKSLKVLEGLMERRGGDLDAAVAEVGPALKQLEAAGAEIRALAAGLGPEAGANLRALERTLDSAQELLEILKAKPNRVLFGTPSAKDRETARKRVEEARTKEKASEAPAR